jgi:hypothetical protein
MLDNATLGTNIQNLTPTFLEAVAIERLAEAYRAYCADAETNGIAISSSVLAAAKEAMKAALVGMSTPVLGSAKIQAGCVAFWASIAPLFATAWSGSTGMTPPSCAGLAAALDPVFIANKSGNKSLEVASNAVADEIHKQTAGSLNTKLAGVGTGAVVFPGPLSFPII